MRKLFVIALFVALVHFIPAHVNAQVDPGTDNLTHWYSFDDGTANDQVGDAHGVVVGDAIIADGALQIDSLDQWVELPGDLVLVQDYEAITVSTWFTPEDSANNGFHMVVYFGDSVDGLGSNGFFISPCRGDDVSRAAISCGVTTEPWTAENGVNGPETNDGILHHMVVTIDDAELNFYVDGEWMGVAELLDLNALWNISQNYAYIGRGGYTADPVLLGDIHDVQIYNRVLSGEEVLFLYQNDPTTAVENRVSTQPQDFRLAQNYPNPFNPSTTIEYSLSKATTARVSIYNMVGQKVATLVDGLHQAGTFKVIWDGLDDFGQSVNSGLYIYKLETEDFSSAKKMLLMK
jgi:hypothetical protein